MALKDILKGNISPVKQRESTILRILAKKANFVHTLGEKRPINIINNKAYISYMLYNGQLVSILIDVEHLS